MGQPHYGVFICIHRKVCEIAYYVRRVPICPGIKRKEAGDRDRIKGDIADGKCNCYRIRYFCVNGSDSNCWGSIVVHVEGVGRSGHSITVGITGENTEKHFCNIHFYQIGSRVPYDGINIRGIRENKTVHLTRSNRYLPRLTTVTRILTEYGEGVLLQVHKLIVDSDITGLIPFRGCQHGIRKLCIIHHHGKRLVRTALVFIPRSDSELDGCI